MTAASPLGLRRRVLLVTCLVTSFGSACTQSERLRLVCEHCACSPGARDLSHPIACEQLPVEQFVYCCVADGS